MNATKNLTRECDPLGLYGPEEPPVPAALLWVGLVHCYCVVVIGTLGSVLALWCVATCTKTRRPVKVLVFCVFLPVLVICLATRPVIGEARAALLTCDSHRISKTVLNITIAAYIFLAQIELASIATIAVVRAVSVWAPHGPTLGMRGAVVLVVVTCIYSTLSALGLMKLMAMGRLADSEAFTRMNVLFFVNSTLPALITGIAYIFMICVIQRNKRRLVACQQPARVTTMNQATQAMLAVFISNLVFGLPHSIYHLMGKQPVYVSLIFHIIFSTHFVVDPLAYIWFNRGYRKKVLSLVNKVTQSTSSSKVSTAPFDQQKQQNSPPHTQENSYL